MYIDLSLGQQMKEGSDMRKCGTVCSSRAAIDNMHVEVQVVDSHPYYSQWCTLEVWHMRSERNNLNRHVGPLLTTYNPLIFSTTL